MKRAISFAMVERDDVIPKVLREQLADELMMLSNELRRAKDEKDESHATLWLEALAERLNHLMGDYSAEILRHAYEQDRIECRKIVDLAAYRG